MSRQASEGGLGLLPRSADITEERSVEDPVTSHLPHGFFDDPMQQKLASGVNIVKETKEQERIEANALENFLETIEELPSGYEEDEVEAGTVHGQQEILDVGLQFAYESKILSLRERSEKIAAKRKNIGA